MPLATHSFLVHAVGGVGAFYDSTEVAANAGIIFTLKTDRTWEITFDAGDLGSGTPLTGTWLNAGGTAANYEVRYTSSSEVGSPAITNNASSYTAMTANRAFDISKNGANASNVLTIEIRGIGIGGYVSAATALGVNGAP
jgi:hypothetical protein